MRRPTLSARRALAAFAASMVAVVAVGPVATHTAAAADGPVVTVMPSTGLDDGDLVKVNIKTTADHPVSAAQVWLCKPGVDFQEGPVDPAPDFKPDAGNCPSKPISSSAEPAKVERQGISKFTQEADGATIPFRVGIGIVKWGGAQDDEFTMQCDPDNPCDLVVQLLTGPAGQPARWKPTIVPLAFGSADPITACGGPAAGIVSSAGSDRMNDAWVRWTLEDCENGSASGALTRAVFNGEGESLSAYDNGLSDVAYSALGYDEGAALVPDASEARDSVAVPVGVNAVVLAVGGGKVLPNGNRVPYGEITLTADEFTAMLAGGKAGLTAGLEDHPSETGILQHNPELAAGAFDSSGGLTVGAAAERSVVAYLSTAFAKSASPDLFKVPNIGTFQDSLKGRTRNVDSSFGLADPSYTAALDTFSGRPVLKKELAKAATFQVSGGVWVFTDRATARAFGLTIVNVELPGGQVVGPTDEALRAAVERMHEDDRGILQPDVTMTKDGDGPVPYPLTFVEYAMAPAEPLFVAATCVLRPQSQANLERWLDFITGPGQSQLPAGMLPLDDDLAEQAAAAIPEVGVSEVTGSCAGRTTNPETPVTTSTTVRPATTAPTTIAGSDGGTPSQSSSPSRSSARSSSSSTATTIAGGEVTIEAEDDGPDVVDLVIPAFAGAATVSPGRAVVALVGIVALTTLVMVANARSGDRRRVVGPGAGGGSA